MGSLTVVAMAPFFGHAADLVQAGEDVAVQDLGAEGPIEASFDVGVLGRLARLVCGRSTPCRSAHFPSTALMNPGPLSRRSRWGAPRSPTSSSSARTTRSDSRLVSTSIHKDSRLRSSSTLKVRKRHPDHSASAMKPINYR